MSMRKLLATSAAMSLLAVQFLCDPHQRALAKPLTCQEVPGGGLTSSRPAVATFSHWAVSGLYLFVRGLNNRIYENYCEYPVDKVSACSNAASWSGWSEVPGNGITLSAPAAIDRYGDATGSQLLFVRALTTEFTGISSTVPDGLRFRGAALLCPDLLPFGIIPF
jgi:hypothetical protein